MRLPGVCVAPVLLVAAHVAASPQATARPSILLVLTDDQGWGDVHSHGMRELDTPVLDRLAAAGTRFDRFYVSPVCAPTRAALLTGRWPLRTGVHGVTRGRETMRAAEVTLAESLAAAGYRTGLFGKWHNGAHHPHDPLGQGFSEFFGFAAGHWNNYFDTRLVDGAREVETQGWISDVLTDRAIRFVESSSDRPFLCAVTYNAPHGPFQVPDAPYEKYRERGFEPRDAAIYGMVDDLDRNVGRLLEALERTGRARDTIVVFLTDNGPNGARYNGGMRGAKGSVDEGGVRVPLFVRWPGVIGAGRVVREPAAHVDLLPTLLDLAGVERAVDAPPLDGVSLAPLLRGQEASLPERLLYSHWRGRGAVRSRRWRAVDRGQGWELYDMWSDPGQRVDVAATEPDRTAELAAAYREWYADVTGAGLDPIPTEVGHPGFDRVELPAHEAFLTPGDGEGIEYHGGQGWANDWIARWTSTGARAEWPIRVVRAGRYAVSLLYAAPASGVGARLRVERGGTHVEAAVAEAFDPEPVPSPDRVQRIEVYEKAWHALPLGSLELAEGIGPLRLTAPLLPGGVAPEVKALRLERR